MEANKPPIIIQQKEIKKVDKPKLPNEEQPDSEEPLTIPRRAPDTPDSGEDGEEKPKETGDGDPSGPGE
jgi:hypothetical protein